MSNLVLLSGGLDSAVCLALACQDGETGALTFDYNQNHRREIVAARRVAEWAGVPLMVLRFELPVRSPLVTGDIQPWQPGISTNYLPGRNMIFLALAASIALDQGSDKLWFGINAADQEGFPDCRPEFIRAFTAVSPGIVIMTPLIDCTKTEIRRMAANLEIPDVTWSCYAGGEEPCGICDACKA